VEAAKIAAVETAEAAGMEASTSAPPAEYLRTGDQDEKGD
jgi:hypothetical protein